MGFLRDQPVRSEERRVGKECSRDWSSDVCFPISRRASLPRPCMKGETMTHELNTGGDRGYRRIATEEAFATREQIDVYLRMVRDGTADKGMVSLWGFYATSPSDRKSVV